MGFVANRAHHAEVGGIRPGSMPSNAVCLEEEGVVIPPTYLVRNGNSQWEVIRSIFTECTLPNASAGGKSRRSQWRADVAEAGCGILDEPL